MKRNVILGDYMLTKNISVELEQGKKVPSKETYVVFYKSRNKIRIVQKFTSDPKNKLIELNTEECERLMNLLHFYLFNGNYEYRKDTMLIINKRHE